MPNHATLPLWNAADSEEKMNILRGLVDDLYRYVLGNEIDAVVDILRTHVCEDEKEAQSVQLIIDLCRQHPNILNANCEVGHITGSALVVDPRHLQVLLNYHPKFDKWLQFGGHPEYEVAPWMVALREAREETSLLDLHFYPESTSPRPIDIDAHVIAQKGQFPEHYHLDFRYLLATDDYSLAQPSSESKEIKWVKFSDALTMKLDHALLRLIKKAYRSVSTGYSS